MILNYNNKRENNGLIFGIILRFLSKYLLLRIGRLKLLFIEN